MLYKKYIIAILLLLSLISKDALPQDNIDSFISSLHNSDVTTAIALRLPDKTFDSGKVYAQTAERVLTSIRAWPLTKKYSKSLLISKLVQTLDDTARDWYADLLLYDLTSLPTSNILGCFDRTDWLQFSPQLKMTYKETDVEMWHRYLAALPSNAQW